MYIPRDWEFGSALANFGISGGKWLNPNPPGRVVEPPNLALLGTPLADVKPEGKEEKEERLQKQHQLMQR
jgi:hypothetical protein